MGEVVFDEGINLLNQKDARVYAQSPGQERTAALGSAVDLRLTLDCTKSDRTRAEAEKAARGWPRSGGGASGPKPTRWRNSALRRR